MKTRWTVTLLIVLALLFVSPFVFSQTQSFIGTDDQASKLVSSIAPNYVPWINNLWDPSEEAEVFFFIIQAAIGSFIVGYVIGFGKGKKTGIAKPPVNEENA